MIAIELTCSLINVSYYNIKNESKKKAKFQMQKIYYTNDICYTNPSNLLSHEKRYDNVKVIANVEI